MEGSSNTHWQKTSNYSRGLDNSVSSERNQKLLHASRLSLSTDTSNNSIFSTTGRKVRTTFAQVASSEVADIELKVDPLLNNVEYGDISLRKWLDLKQRAIDQFESLHIFRQIVKIVDCAHSQGIVLNNVRPSCFIMSSFNHVSFIESASGSETGSDPISDHGANIGTDGSETNDSGSSEKSGEKDKPVFPMKELLGMETSWYTTPEEISGLSCSCASDIYRLGVLLFELFFSFSTPEDKSQTMSSLRYRVLPPQVLLKWPKEASFCLWLLHPDPSSRPKTSELLQSEFLNEPRDDIDKREATIQLREKIEEQELLLEFLLLMKQSKQEAANKLQDTVSFLSSDIDEIITSQKSPKKKSTNTKYEFDLNKTPDSEPILTNTEENLLSKNTRLLQNFKKLETAYLLTRQLSSNNRGTEDGDGPGGWISPFLDGLCKYLSFTQLRVKADLKQGDLLSSSNLVCAVSFDRDGEFFATAGVNKKIKVFECDGILNRDRDIHYPVVEMGSRSKISSICWNSYIKSQIASSNFEGVVQVWDASRSHVFMELKEHERRVWSVDYSSADPTLLASGSDDGSVKLWSINQGTSIGTIKTKANVCCVKFSTNSGRSLAFGSADHKIYYYDLRNPRVPLCTMIGHNKTVSYIKFVDSTNLVSSSTDNTLKLWDLSSSTSRVIQDPIQSFTGHTNMKNFVGLSVSDGYIATGSETNEVFVYHKAFPMPALSYKFNNINPASGNEADDSSKFISSVCWRGQSSMLVAANSTGDIKVLEMV